MHVLCLEETTIREIQMSDFEEIRCLDAPLANKLQAYAKQLTDFKPTMAQAYSTLVERLSTADAGSHAPEVGTPFPSFVLPDSRGKLMSSTDLLNLGPLVVSFNRGHWCSFCKLELSALTDICQELEQFGGGVVSIIPERGSLTKQLKETLQIPFPVLTDVDNGFALNCGLMISLGGVVSELILKAGVNLSNYQGNNSWFVPIPATFIVGRDGIIIERFVDVDFRHRMSPKKILNIFNQLK